MSTMDNRENAEIFITIIRLTCAQALARFLAARRDIVDGAELPLFAGI